MGSFTGNGSPVQSAMRYPTFLFRLDECIDTCIIMCTHGNHSCAVLIHSSTMHVPINGLLKLQIGHSQIQPLAAKGRLPTQQDSIPQHTARLRQANQMCCCHVVVAKVRTGSM